MIGKVLLRKQIRIYKSAVMNLKKTDQITIQWNGLKKESVVKCVRLFFLFVHYTSRRNLDRFKANPANEYGQ